MIKRIIVVCMLLCTLSVNISFAAVSSIQADDHFNLMIAHLYSNGLLTIQLETYVQYPLAGVSSCTLQKIINNVWTDVESIPKPYPYESNDGSFSGTVDCSSHITPDETYRVKVQIYTNNYSRYIYSSQQTF